MTNLISLLSQELKINKDKLIQILPETLSSIQQEKITAAIPSLRDNKSGDKETLLFLFVQKIRNPILLAENLEVEERDISSLTAAGSVSTRYGYFGRGLYTEKDLFINSKKEVFLASLKKEFSNLEKGYEYVLQGKSVPSKTGNFYFNLESVEQLSSCSSTIYTYISSGDKTLYFKNNVGGLLVVRVFYDLQNIIDRLVSGKNYLVATATWKTFTTLKELIPYFKQKATGCEDTPGIIQNSEITLVFGGKKTMRPGEDLFWFKDVKDRPYFIKIKDNVDYSFNSEVYDSIDCFTKGATATFTNILLKENDQKFTLMITDKSQLS